MNFLTRDIEWNSGTHAVTEESKNIWGAIRNLEGVIWPPGWNRVICIFQKLGVSAAPLATPGSTIPDDTIANCSDFDQKCLWDKNLFWGN